MLNDFLKYEFIYVFFILLIIFLGITLFFKNKLVKKISLLLFGIFCSLFIIELILSFFMPLSETKYNQKYMYEIKDRKLYISRDITCLDDNSNIIKKTDDVNLNKEKILYDKNYSIYYNGFRYTKCNEKADETYLFFGCSFIFGIALDDNETVSYCFSKLFNFEKNIINCGVPAHATNSTLNILNNNVFENLLSKNSKIKKSFYLLIPDHIYRNFRYEGSCIDGYIYENNKFKKIKQPYGIFKNIFIRSYLFRKEFLPLIDAKNIQYYTDYLLLSLKKINEILEEKYKSKLVVIVWPGFYGENFEEKIKKLNIDLIFLPEYFNSIDDGYIIQYDGHPTAKANKEIAEKLYNYL